MNQLPVNFLWPQFLWLLLILPLLVLLYWWLLRRRKQASLRFASLSIVREAMGKGPGWRRHVPAAIFLTAIATLVVGFALVFARRTTRPLQALVKVAGTVADGDLRVRSVPGIAASAARSSVACASSALTSITT